VKNRMNRSWLFLAFVLVFSRVELAAWNNHGHLLVAAAAYQRLTPTVRARVDALVKLNPFFKQWTTKIPAGMSASDRSAALFAIAATWPDQIKSAKGYVDDGDQPSGANAAQNVGYSDKLQHRYWHFANQPFSVDHTTLPPTPTPNGIERITLFRTTLASSAADRLKSYDLVWLLHLVGDMHQPLHASTRVSAAQPRGDRGGNLVALCAKPCTDELHAFWDGVLGTDEVLASVLAAAKALPSPAPAAANDLDPTHWAANSLTLAESNVYVLPIGSGAGPFTITPSYTMAAKTLATNQIALAGARLAALLNATVK
jgi:S1/P1 nuclease